MIRHRIVMTVMGSLTVIAIVATSALGFWVDRSQCRAAAQAIENSRTMWIYLLKKNPGPEADAFRIELDKRIPPAHCEGGRLVVESSPASS